MNVRDKQIIDLALEGKSASKILDFFKSESIPIADKTIRKVLKNNGYEYIQNKHIWVQIESNKELIETNSDEVEANIKVIKEEELIETNSNSNSISFWGEVGLTPQEFSVMKEIIHERMTEKNETDNSQIYNEIAKLKTRKRKNKTYYISEELIEEVGEIADQLNVKLSQLVEVSLIEFIHKYKTIKN